MQVSSTGGLPARRDSGARSPRAGVRQEAGPAATAPAQPAPRGQWRAARARRPGEPPGDDDTTEREQPSTSPDATLASPPAGPRSDAVAVRSVRRIDGKLLDLVFLLGLGGVFLANATIAVIEPRQFTMLVADSALGTLIGDATWIAPIITVNDVIIGLAVIAAHRFQRLRLPVLAWAGVWLMIVTLVKATTIG
jgi:hypothetical protein